MKPFADIRDRQGRISKLKQRARFLTLASLARCRNVKKNIRGQTIETDRWRLQFIKLLLNVLIRREWVSFIRRWQFNHIDFLI